MTEELAWMIGLLFGGAELDEQSGQWWFPLGDGRGLAVSCPWQIIAAGRVALASGDHGQQYGLSAPIDGPAKATQLLVGRNVESVSFAAGSSELEVCLQGDAALRTFNDSSGYEGWDLSGPGEARWICQGGGNVVRLVDGEPDPHGESTDA